MMKKAKTKNKIKNILHRGFVIIMREYDQYSLGNTLEAIAFTIAVCFVLIEALFFNSYKGAIIATILFLVFTIANITLIKLAEEFCWMGGFFTKAQYLQEVNFEAVEGKQGTDRYYYPEIEEKIKKIDNKLEDGYVFSDMKTEKWKTAYKQEILDLMRSQYKISDENQQRILKLLKRLKKNMVNKKEKEADFQAGVNIEAMERMADMDLVGDDFRIGETGKD